ACKIAQEKGGNRFEIYKISLEKEGSSAMAQLIETAIEEERLSLFYQPIVSLHAENTEIYEVCLRMVDSDGNPVSTGEMFQEAEKHNLNLKLDMWVIRQSVKILVAQIKKKHHTHFFIKLSAQSLQKKEILVYIAQLLKKTKLPGEHLIFEFREAVALNQISLTKAFIKQVNKFKCKTALEHFGKETNFETVLQHLPVNYVKIDASYSKDLLDSEEQQTALKNIVQLTKKTGQQTIAVAVEDANCLAILWEHTIDFAQGHYIQEPLGELEFDFSGEE
ncbi:MAG: EAL domain-containing protein, partial [Thiomargarita sp.]|nr:EAL domain-containing protein [Thiomargarita sp.]